jgi:hypothetical protein
MYEEEPKARDLKPLGGVEAGARTIFVKQYSQPLALAQFCNARATKTDGKNLSKSAEKEAGPIKDVNFCSHLLSTIEDTCRIIGPVKDGPGKP